MSDPYAQRDTSRRLEQTQVTERPYKQYGTAMPSGYPVNVAFFRTDLGWWIYNDGTRQLTAHTMDIRFPRTAYAAATTDVSIMAVLPSDYALYLTRLEMFATLGATNDGSNFWFYQLQRNSADIAGGVNTSLGAPGDYQLGLSLTTIVTINGYLNIRVAKTGAPSNISVAGLVRYRLIIP